MVSEEETESWNILGTTATAIPSSCRTPSGIPLSRRSVFWAATSTRRTETDLRDALSLLVEQKPLVYAYYVDETADEMIAGNAALALVYLSAGQPPPWSPTPISPTRFRRRDPTLWIDSWFIPADQHTRKTPKSFWIFWCREDVAMLNF